MLNEGVYDRPAEIVIVDARRLPRENYLKVRQGYQRLVNAGCVVVIGPFISDNSVNLCDTVNATGVACLGWTGTTRFYGEYCFTVANGDPMTPRAPPCTASRTPGSPPPPRSRPGWSGSSGCRARTAGPAAT